MSKVYVVTNPELGWDCVVGVFNCDDNSKESLEKVFPKGEHVIRQQQVHKDTLEFEDLGDLEDE